MWQRMSDMFGRQSYFDSLIYASGCEVTVYCDGDGDNPVRVLSADSGFRMGKVSRMWVDGFLADIRRTLVFGDTDEHAIRIEFEDYTIPEYAFYGCTALTAVTIESSVQHIGLNAFGGASNVARIVVGGNSLPQTNLNAFGYIMNMCCSNYGIDVARVYVSREALHQSLSNGWGMLMGVATFKPLLDEHPFSVAANKTVAFSSANLQYLGSQDVFTFGKWQGEKFGKNGGNETAPASRGQYYEPIDLFSWGCSGGQYDGYHRHYKPYDCIYYSSASAYAYYYGIVYGSQNYSYNLAATGADWGVANRFMSERVRTGWRTLTANEWQYLFQTRANATARRAKATVGGVKGLILLPDDWVLPTGATLTTDAVATTSYASNELSVDDWEPLEDAGAIFLPATGFRAAVSTNSATTTADDYTGTGKPTVGDADHSGNPTGSYWSTTYSGSQAYRFYFANGSNTPKSATERYKGYGVRLVRDN